MIPARYKFLFAKNQGVLKTHRGSDFGALEVARLLSRLTSTPLYFTKISRLIVDMNRSPVSPTALSRWTNSLSKIEQKQIFEKLYWPYPELIYSKVELAMRFKKSSEPHSRRSFTTTDIRLVHFGIHSFSPYIESSRRDCQIGILFDPKRPLETKAARHLQIHLKRLFPDLGIRLNFPYRGNGDGLTTDLRKRYRPTQYVGLELNQVLLK